MYERGMDTLVMNTVLTAHGEDDLSSNRQDLEEDGLVYDPCSTVFCVQNDGDHRERNRDAK